MNMKSPGRTRGRLKTWWIDVVGRHIPVNGGRGRHKTMYMDAVDRDMKMVGLE